MKQKTLITLYGSKPIPLRDQLSTLMQKVVELLDADVFIPYRSEQMHGTLTGMETIRIGKYYYNKNIWESEQRKEQMDLHTLPEVVKNHFPMQIRFGGFAPGNHSFISHGKSAYERSFRIDTLSGRVLLIGWPHLDGDFSKPLLWHFREEMKQTCKTGHKYSNDNDFYIVLGELRKTGEPEIQNRFGHVEKNLREYLFEFPFEVRLREIFIARYSDPRLPADSTTAERLNY